jgi:hypothetical protein
MESYTRTAAPEFHSDENLPTKGSLGQLARLHKLIVTQELRFRKKISTAAMVDAFDGCCVFPLFSDGSLTFLWWVDSLLWCTVAGFLLLRYGRKPYSGAVARVPAMHLPI